MKPRVTVVDYGLGNLLSVTRALEHCGAAVSVTSSGIDVLEAARLVLPGVGAFRSGMEELEKRGLTEPVRDYAASGGPFLGICLGMQMMLETSEEFGVRRGLGLIAGKVVAIPRNGGASTRKTPHIGWSTLRRSRTGRDWSGSILEGLEADRVSAYFVHSYSAVPDDARDVLAECVYDGWIVTAAIAKANAIGCQFHPEKSGETGLAILSNFVRL